MSDGSVVVDTKLNSDGLKSGLNKLGSVASTALKGVAVATGAVATAFAGIVTASVKARGEIEQQIGGVKKIFGDASQELIDNANKAYKTAGISATSYMEQATSFSASLMQATGNNASETAKIADMALIDMADNANTFGTSIENIQNAYQGFAKQNYTMLDNLKLGYGGTKTEMERLLKDAEKLSGVKYDINNLADVYNAIHVIQEEMQIAGTTGKEATETLQGSLGMLRASWENFLSGSGNLSQVVESVGFATQNIIRIVNEAMPAIIENIVNSLPQFIELGGQLLNSIIGGIVQYLPQLMQCAGQVVSQLVQAVIQYLPSVLEVGANVLNELINGVISVLPSLIPMVLQIFEILVTTIINNLPKILESGIKILSELIKGLAQMIPELIPKMIECMMTIYETLIDNIDLIIDAGIELIIALAEGLIDALPILIEKIPIIIEKLLNAIANNLPKLVETGIKLIVQLGVGLIKAIPQLLSKIPQIISSMLSAFGSVIGGFAEVGANIVKGIFNGINNMTGWLFDKIKGFKDAVLNKFKSFFGIHSPSTLFRDKIGKFLALGIGDGFTENVSKAYKEMQNAVDTETSKLSSNLTASNSVDIIRNANISATLDEINTDREITVNAITNLDGKVLTRAVNTVNARQRLAYGIG